MHALLAIILLAAQADSADAGLRMVLGAEAARPDQAVPGILLVSTPDGRTRPATLRVTSASPARLWWRAGAGTACADTAGGEAELAAGHLVGGEDAFYFCARPRTAAPLRLVASMRAGAGSATTVAELPAPPPGGISPLWIPVLTALLGLGSGILVNFATSRNQLHAELARRRQESEKKEREERLEIVTAIHGGLLADVRRALELLREYAASRPPRKPEPPMVLPVGGMETVTKSQTVCDFLENGAGKDDFARFRRIYALMSRHNRVARQQEDPIARRAAAREALDAIEAELSQ